MARISSQMVTAMSANMQVVNLKALVSISGRMEAVTRVSFSMVWSTVMVNGRKKRTMSMEIRSVTCTTECIRQTRNMDMASSSGSRVIVTRATIKMTSDMVTVRWSGQMRACIWACGTRAFNTAWVSWSSLMGSEGPVSLKRTSSKNLWKGGSSSNPTESYSAKIAYRFLMRLSLKESKVMPIFSGLLIWTKLSSYKMI